MEPREINPPESASTPESDLDRRIRAKLAEKARTDALVKALEEQVAQEREEEENRPEKTPKEKAEELESDKKENPLKYFIIKNMHDTAFACIYGKTKKNATLEDINSKSEESGEKAKFWNFEVPSVSKHYTVFFSSNGFTLQVANPLEVKDAKGNIDRNDPKARYKIVYPNWTYNKEEGTHTLEDGEELLRTKAAEYQTQQEISFKEEAI